MHLTLRAYLRAFASSGWLPASILAVAAAVVLHHYGVRNSQIAIFGVYITCGIAVPGMLWLRLLRGRPAHIAEDLTLGLAVGYCAEIATYVVARAIGAPMLFLLWPFATVVAFAAIPALRHHWRGSGIRAPLAWSWSIAAILGFLLFYSAGTFFTSQHLTGTDTPYVDMPFHLALIGELRNHVPPRIPYVPDIALAYHWFFYAEAAATSWATGIDAVTLLYRLSGLPMFVGFVILTATAARRLTDRWWSGPVAVSVALFGMAATPYMWSGNPVFATQALGNTWLSPTNLFGVAMFAATTLVFIDLLQVDTILPRRHWLLVGLLVCGCAGAKASILPVLIAGSVLAVAGVAVTRRRLNRRAAAGLAVALVALLLADVLIYRGSTGGGVVGLNSLDWFGILHATGVQTAVATGNPDVHAMHIAALLVALVLWSFMWAGAFGLLVRRQVSCADPRIMLLAGICAGGLGAALVLSYPGLSQLYYLKGAVGAFGLLTAAGIAAVLPARSRYLPLVACIAVAALVGAVAAHVIAVIGPAKAPTLATDGLSTVLLAIILPVVALLGVAVSAYILLRLAARKWSLLQGAVPLLLIAVVMGFSLPNVATLLRSPITAKPSSGQAIPGDGIAAAHWLRDHSDPNDLVATNLHCVVPVNKTWLCDSRNFWVSAFSERRVLVEGWAYAGKTTVYQAPFWNQPLLATNDAAFTDPSAITIANLRDEYGVKWLFAYTTIANQDAIGQYATLRHRNGYFAVFQLP